MSKKIHSIQSSDKKDDKYISRYENGQKEIEIPYKDGKINGKQKEWWKNGNKKSEGVYDIKEEEGSVKDGLWTYYNEDGSKKETIEYHNGQEYICSSCKNKKSKITKEYCLSNPLNPKYEEEPLYEHYGDWNINQMWNCRDFKKKT